MTQSIEFLIVRHPETQVDREFMKTEQGVWVPCPEQQLIKGASDKYEYRLSDLGILESEETALAILTYYTEQGKHNLMLLHSDLNRTTEFDEILRGILKKGSIKGEVIHKAVPEFRERSFGSIEGQPKKKVEEAVNKTGKFPTLEHALMYADDFKILAEYLGISNPEPGEPFLNTFKRVNTGVENYILKECFDNKVPQFDYVLIAAHQISGPFLSRALELIIRPPELIERIIKLIERQKDPELLQMYKDCLVPYYHLEPARFNRIRFTYFNNRLWFTCIEQNDRGHLTALKARVIDQETKQTRIEGEDAKRVERVRKSLSKWYAQRGWPIDPDKKVFPFEAYDSEGRHGLTIGSPLELYQIILDKKKFGDPYISNHMGTRKNVDHFPSWIQGTFGYDDLSDQIRGKLLQLTVTPQPNLTSVRIEIHAILKDYISPNQI